MGKAEKKTQIVLNFPADASCFLPAVCRCLVQVESYRWAQLSAS